MPMRPSIRLVAAAATLILVAGCATSNRRAPVEDQGRPAGGSAASSAASSAPKVLPGAENAGKPGYYTVKPGDTLIRIALESGQNWRDIASWNNLENPNLIEVGQVVRVAPPASEPAAGVVVKPLGAPRVEPPRPTTAAVPADTRNPPPARPSVAASGGSGPVGAAPGAATSSTSATAAAPASTEAREGEEPNWGWPAAGPVLANFEEGRNKGLTIGGKAGDPVVAAADGRVVYAGSGLRGYGNLVIVKHSADFLTAYAHNQTLLVKEDQAVKRGQKIAEMGSTDAERVQLHFEIRKKGKPLDPARQLPSR